MPTIWDSTRVHPLSPLQKRAAPATFTVLPCRPAVTARGARRSARYNRSHSESPPSFDFARFPVTAFFALAILMLCIALAFVLLPLLRRQRGEAAEISDEASNVSIFRAQQRVLVVDFERVVISHAARY